MERYSVLISEIKAYAFGGVVDVLFSEKKMISLSSVSSRHYFLVDFRSDFLEITWRYTLEHDELSIKRAFDKGVFVSIFRQEKIAHELLFEVMAKLQAHRSAFLFFALKHSIRYSPFTFTLSSF
jgi:hypothetical protein